MDILYGLFYVSLSNGVGDFRPPSFDANTTVTIKVVIYSVYLLQMLLNNIVLLNFVIALISQVYENVMNSKMKYTYIQRQDLNSEYARTKSFLKDFMYWKSDDEISIATLILINCEEKFEGDE